jgi:1,4-alpha-glucan branching enzyme
VDWLNEAVAESYIPLLNMLFGLAERGVLPQVTLSVTPVVVQQLADKEFVGALKDYLKTKVLAAKDDAKLFQKRGERELSLLAYMWERFFEGVLKDFEQVYDEDLPSAFRKLQDQFEAELMSSSATHAYLPLLLFDESVAAQIRGGVSVYKKFFGKEPAGFWLPECGYRPSYRWTPPILSSKESVQRKGVDELLAENGIHYFVVDTHLLAGGKAIGTYLARFKELARLWHLFVKECPIPPRSYSPYQAYISSAGVAFFVRDPRTGLQVWSGEWGYPGDGWYLDFHKKHYPGGHRYWRVTSQKVDLAEKQIYVPSMAEERMRENASHFKELVKQILYEQKRETGKVGVLVAPFDTELFGHWWHEGVKWLELVLEWIEADPQIGLCTLKHYLQKHPPELIVSLPEGSWGEGGFHWIWLNEWTQWTWTHIYEAEERMREVLRIAECANERGEQILKQLARELFLLQSSDWQFLISTWTARDYAERRVLEHKKSFDALFQIYKKCLERGTLEKEDEDFLNLCKRRDRVFEDISLDWWRC